MHIQKLLTESGKNWGDEERLQSKDQRGQLGVRTREVSSESPIAQSLLKIFPK